MNKYIHRGDILSAVLLAFFLTWYNVLGTAQNSELTPLNIARLAMGFAMVAVLLEVVFALICYLRKQSLFGRRKSAFFSWKRTLPVSVLVSGGSTLFYYIYLSPPIASGTWALLFAGFILGTLLTMLYFYSLVEKK